MKVQSIIILSAWLLLLLSACGGEYNYPPVLDEISRVADDDPGRAMTMLDSVRPTLDLDDESVMMYRSLLTIKARDKAYITHTSDSAIVAVINHYENGGDPRHLPLAYYYGGRVYSDLGDAPQALDYFLKAWELLKDDNSNSKLKSVLTGQLCRLYQKQNLYKEATYFLMLSHQNDIATADTIGQIYNLTDFGLIHQKLDDLDSAMYYFRKAKDLADKFADKSPGMLCTAQLQLANGFLELGQLDSALYYLKPIISTCNKSNQPAVYAIATSLYYDLNQLDSAEYYANEILRLGFNQGRHTAYGYLTQIEERRGNIHKSLVYMTKFRQCEDSISRTIETELIAKLNAQYNYQLREKKAQELEAENNRKTMIILSIVGGLILLSLLFVVIVLSLRRKNIKTKFQLYKIEQLKNSIETANEKYITENNAIIAELKNKMHENSAEKELIQERLRLKEQELKAFIEYLSLKKQQYDAINNQIGASDFINDLKYNLSLKNSPLTPNEWSMIIAYTEHLYPTFKSQLLSLCNLSEIEYRICVLIKLKLSPTAISVGVNRSKESISSIRRRLYSKIFNQKGTPADFDKFLDTIN